MSDVFISYARSTAREAMRVVEALRSLGYSVWIDDALPAHRAYSPVIEEEITAAKAAVVIWSADAAQSEWVLSEANRAREERKLVQVRIDEVRLPMPFDTIQCADLAGWTGDADHRGWRKVAESVAALAGKASPPQATASPPPGAGSPAAEIETNNLPKRLPSLIGREHELEALAGLLAKAELVTLTGTGGVGKTRLAIEVAERTLGQFEDGVWLIELAPVTDGSQVPGAVARAMAIELQAGREPFEALIDRLRLRRCLLVLDNCEHVIEAVAALAEAILEASAGIKLIASSQEPLGVETERVFRLPSLAGPDAATLFADRAAAADASFTIRPRDAAAVAGICERLDGIPLAIEMAAARAPSLGCDGVFERLDDRFRLLTGGRRTALPRQRTLAATLDWSHGLLSEHDAIVFRRLGVFAGGFTLEAAAAVAADEALDALDVADAITSLVAKSLVAVDPGAEHLRYRLLETTRAYAHEKLDAAGETQAPQRRHAEWFAAFVRSAGEDYERHVSDDDFAARYFGDNDNLERALDWCFGPNGDPQLGIYIVGNGESIWACQSLYNAYLGWLQRAAAQVGPTTAPAARARFLCATASAHMMTVPANGLEVVDEAIGAMRALSDPMELARALNTKGWTLYALGRGSEAVGLAEESMRIVARLPTGRTPSQSKTLAGVLRAPTDPVAGEALIREGIADLRAFGADGLANWFEQDMKFGVRMPPAEAVEFWRALLARVKPREMLADLTTSLAADELLAQLAKRGDPEALEEAMEVYRRYYRLLQPGMGRAFACLAMSHVALKQERLQEAAMLLGYAEPIATPMGAAVYFFDPALLHEALAKALAPGELAALLAAGAKLTETEALELPLAQPPSQD